MSTVQTTQTKSSQNANPETTTFDKLAQHALFVCNEADQLPQQWIYAVDDAWIHDGFSENNEKKRSLFASSDLDGNNRHKPLPAEEVLSKISKKNEATSAVTDVELSFSPSEPNAKRHEDQTTAEILINFMREKTAHNYGLCFCTFEYFWTHIKEINVPENAVFFDIRHQLADSMDLKTDWQKKIASLNVFEAASTGDMHRLGLHLYFALKLGKLPEKAPIKCNIGPNHLVILSSRVFDNVPGKELLLQSFLNVQKEIWKATAKDCASEKTPHQGLDFTFIPIPKTADDDLFKTGLEIFHNTFKDAANWEAKEMALRTDMETIWRGFDQPASEAWGHVERTDFSALRSNSWLPVDKEKAREALRCLYLAQWRREDAIAVGTMRKFLQYVVDADGAVFAHPTDGLANCRIYLQTRPGILFVLGLGLFLRELNPGGKEGRVKPKVEFSCNSSVSCTECSKQLAQVTLKINIGSGGIEGLKEHFFKSKTSGATLALWKVAQAQGRMLGHEINGVSIGSITGPDKGTLMKQLVKDENHLCLDVAKSHPIFTEEAILFRFPVAPPKTVGG